MPNEFDKVLRENFGEIFLPIVQRYLKVTITKVSDIAGSLQKTVGREPDFVKMVEDSDGQSFILHIEFQSTNEKRMLDRMRTYHALLMEKYRVPVLPVVIYLGRAPFRARRRAEEREIFSGFELIDVARRDYREFLGSKMLEEVLLSVLADFGDHDPKAVIRLILSKLFELGGNSDQTRRAVEQLLILSRITNLEEEVENELHDMPIMIDIQNDRLYQRGKVEGKIEGKIEGKVEERTKAVKSLLRHGKMTVSEIAITMEMDVEQVLSLKAEMDRE